MIPSLVVTGLGTVHAGGTGADAVADALARESPQTTEVDRSAGFHAPGSSRTALLARGVDLSRWLSPRKARRMSRPSKFAVAAARAALEDAGLATEASVDERRAVAMATSFGTSRFAEELVRAILLTGPEAASPFHFSESVANAPAAQVAIATGSRGTNVAVTQREAGPLDALVLGARELLLGRADLALVGTCDEINPLVHAVLDRFRALVRPSGDGEVARPFDRRRRGFLAAEGATVLVVETGEGARSRSREPLARIAGWARGFDPTAPAYGWGTGADGLADRLRRALGEWEIDPGSIDAVVSGASGAVGGDRLEARVLRELFGGDPPPVAAPKGALGEYGGGHLAAAVLAPTRGLWPTAGFGEPDPDLGLTPISERSPDPPHRILVSGLAAGGAAVWVVLDRA